MEELTSIFKKYNPYLQKEDFALLQSKIKRQHFQKGDYLIKQGQIATNLYFLLKGGVKCYLPQKDNVIWAEFEEEFVTLPDSFHQQTPAKEALICLEDTVAYVIKYTDLENVYQQNIKWANWGRKLAEHWINVIESTYKILTLKSATERYHAIQLLRPDILQRASLKDISSFLGMSQVSISRIRANTQIKNGN